MKDIEKKVKEEYGWSPTSQTIQCYVKDNISGCSPLKIGCTSRIQHRVLKKLATLFESYVKINKTNGKVGDNTKKKLTIRVNKAMGKQETVLSYQLLNRLLQETADDIPALRKTLSHIGESS